MTERTGNWTHYRTCNLCEAMCGLEIAMDGERIVAIRGDKADPFSQGHICPKAIALQDIYADPDRLKSPLRRTAAGWESIGWDEAFDEVAANLKRIQAQHGRNAVGVYLGNPNVHNLGSQLLLSTLVRALRTTNRFSATSVDQLPQQFTARLMFGHQLLLPIPDVDRTDYFLIFGANPLASNGSLMTAAGIERRLKAIQRRGGRVVVVDPRRTESAALADEHLFIRPASDVLLLLALVHTILAEGLAHPGRLAEFTDGLDALWELVAPYLPEVVSGPTGIPAETIGHLAREFAAAPSAVCYGRIGVSTQRFGGLCHWLINVLNIITGNLDRPGGAMFTTPAIDIVDKGRAGKMGRWRSRARGLAEFAGELPAAVLAEEILTPGEGQIRAMVTVAGNPVLSTPNGRRLDEALASLDYMVAIDIYHNETTRHAHIILPPTTGLETEHYDLIFHVLAVRNSAKYSPALFEPAAGARHDWQIYGTLAQRLSNGEKLLDPAHPLNQMTPAMMLDFGLRTGPYGQDGLSLEKLQTEPHGVDLGPLQPRLPERLFTADKRIQLVPELMAQDMARVQQVFSDGTQELDGFDLTLIGRRQLRSNNSWMHNAERLVRGKERCTLLMHPNDAAARGLATGQTVMIESRVGCIELPLELTETIMPGVVSIPHGWGHDRPGVQLRVAQRHAGASINDLTDEMVLDDLTGNAAFIGLPVRVGNYK
ncbi:MAG: molybdopterin oxidoreductase family protein [Chloroflexi bacterium]|nr:molybdopterin oxidoreductase family protein [Chloroflexota bacterium]MCI0576872.1 molybdopterin oxidoreductase family protein [Chloroflexota bacterium]MCI0646474.1 molybdopterin oxidoreductase family protein [Chloroflexota bacterium]MCI0726174.1 molybdopterin oxidoreductase family protein [Chloroflexota bacterium]